VRGWCVAGSVAGSVAGHVGGCVGARVRDCADIVGAGVPRPGGAALGLVARRY
jgi:hypothetical protein